MVEIAVRLSGQLECAKANVIEGFVNDAERFIGVLEQLMGRHGGIVRLHDGIRDFGRWHNRDQQFSRSGSGAATKQSLKTVAVIGLLANNIQVTLRMK